MQFTTQEMGRKRMLGLILKWMEFKYRYLLYYGRYNDFFGKRRSPWTCGAAGKDTSYQLEGKQWVSSMQTIKLLALQGITTD
jgi:hypothetical protein